MDLEPFIIEWKKQQEKQREEKETRIPLRLPLPLPLPPIPNYENNDSSPNTDDSGLVYIPLHNDDLSSSYKI